MLSVNFLSKKNKVRILVICVAFALTVTSAFVYSGIQTKKTANLLAVESASIAEGYVNDFTEGFLATVDQTSGQFSKEAREELATTVTGTMKTALSGSAPGNIQTVTRSVETAVKDKVQELGITLSKEDQKMLTSGITALVISSVYKAIGDRGLTSTSDLETLRKGLEARINSIEGLYDGQAESLQASINNMYSYVQNKDFSSANQLQAIEELSKKLSALDTALGDLKDQIPTEPSDGGQVDPNLLSSVSILKEQVTEILTVIEKDESGKLQEELKEYQEALEELRKQLEASDSPLTKADIEKVQGNITTLESSLHDKLEIEAEKYKQLEQELANFSADFAGQLLQLTNVQNNFQTTLNILHKNLGEGSVDERIRTISQDIDGKISSQKIELSERMNELNQELEDTGLLLNQEVDVLEGQVSNLEEGQEELKESAKDLQNRITQSSADITGLTESLQETKDELSDLIDGNTANIADLLEKLKEAKEQLQNKVDAQDSVTKEEKEEIEATMDDINALIAQLEGRLNTTDSKLEETKQSLTGSLATIATLQQNLTTASDTLVRLEGDLTSLESDMTTELGKKADTDTVNQQLGTKADTTTVNQQLDTKADKQQMTEELGKKADTDTVNQQLGTKADTDTVNQQLETKADKQQMTEELGKKADTDTVNQQLGTKADTTNVNQQLGTKADTTTVNQQLGTKADSTDVQLLQQKVEDLENTLDSMIQYSNSGGKPTIVLALP